MDPDLEVNLRTRLATEGDGTIIDAPELSPVPQAPDALREWLDRPWDIDLTGRLVE